MSIVHPQISRRILRPFGQRTRLGFVLVVCLCLFFCASHGVAQDPPDPNSATERHKRWRRVLFWKQRMKLLSLKRKEGSLLALIESFDRRQVVLMQRIQTLQDKRLVMAKVVKKRLAAWRAQQRLNEKMLQSIQPRLRNFYRFVRLGRARLLMGARSLKTLALRWRAMHLTTLKDLAMLRKYQAARLKARKASELWRKKQKNLEALLKKIHKEQLALRKQRREKAKTLQALYKEVHVYRRVLKELRGSGHQLRAMLDKWKQKGPTGGLSLRKGQLPWPIRRFTGHCQKYVLKVSGSFRSLRCKKKSPHVLSLKGKHQRPGATIHVPVGTPIQAVAKGKVAHLGWIRGYGQVLLIDHGQHFFSLYAHLSAPRKKLGEEVRGGQIIALSGATGMLGKPVLYFELRHHARVLPTLAWLSPLRP